MTVPDQLPGGYPTMRDVAREAAVSTMTVSRVLRDEPGVSDETKVRVLAAVAALGYRRNENARSLRLGRPSGLLGLVVTNLANPFYSQLALGVESYFGGHGKRVILGNSAESLDQERQLLHDFASRRVDGVIVVPTGHDHGHLAADRLGGMPVVLAASPPTDVDADAVVLDDFGGTREAVARLIGRGHDRIAFLGLPESTWTGSERRRGYSAALADAGIRLDERLVRSQSPSLDAAERATRELISRRNPPTAVFAANNRNTLGAYRALRHSARTVELAGFDNFELADLLTMPLTLVSYDPQEMGRQAARLLDERLRADSPPGDRSARRVVIRTTLVEYRGLRHRDADADAETPKDGHGS